MAVQSTVEARSALTRPGAEYDIAFTDVISGVATEAIPFGVYVVQKDTGWELPASIADVQNFQGGVALVDNLVPTEQGYVEGDNIRVLRSGRCGVLAGGALGRGGNVHVRIAAGQLGEFLPAADGVNSVQLTNCRVYAPSSATTGVVEINPAPASA